MRVLRSATTVVHLVTLLEQALGRKAVIEVVARPAADVSATLASIDALAALTGYAPSTTLEQGIPRFVAWFRAYHQLGGERFLQDSC